MIEKFKLILAQMKIEPDLQRNLRKILEILETTEGDLYLFPELALTGYRDFTELSPSLITEALEEIQKKAGQRLILLGAPHSQDSYTNGYFSVSHKGVELLAEKSLLFPGLDDKFGLTSGTIRKPLTLGEDINFGIIMCFELRSPEISRSFIAEGFSGLIIPAQWPEIRIEHFITLLKARAIENQCYVIGINGVGKINNLVLGGNSRIYGPAGEEILNLGPMEEIASVQLDFKLFSLSYPLRTPFSKSKKLMSLEDLLRITSRRRKRGQTMVFTNGCFDILHAGHTDYLSKARSQGDFLVVGLNSDNSVRKIKGEGRPINPQHLRAEVLASLEAVDYIVLFEEESPENIIKALKPDILVKGADWEEEKIVGASFVKSYGGRVLRIPFSYDLSTTKIWKRLSKEDNL